ncbi:hypothetical protein GCD22_02500 [Acidithiobacillus thiooxidans ATCC 19377]|uniref:Uncharacterized protein n=1 Tax=Acidithiobacillus thiooxidans ATCC 19377 TaxID=637390 RepID=A0A5P9XSU3_ACITH|nr:hypothetical protein GCD22_02500 [Acidithiobacillus thiooxidans ATCC 19377]
MAENQVVSDPNLYDLHHKIFPKYHLVTYLPIHKADQSKVDQTAQAQAERPGSQRCKECNSQ